jgi:Icc-related predicted phosphoesterase
MYPTSQVHWPPKKWALDGQIAAKTTGASGVKETIEEFFVLEAA